jgi:hypothetical protein
MALIGKRLRKITLSAGMTNNFTGLAILSFIVLMESIQAQDLDPRAYIRFPVNSTYFFAGFGYSTGSVVTDPTAPIQDLQADVESPVLGAGHSFSLFGRSAQLTAALPYGWAQLSGIVLGDARTATRSGFGDMRLKFSVLLLGGAAATLGELAKAPRTTLLGTSLTIIAPTGQYFPDKLINLGTNRWFFKPELGVSQPLGNRWLMDLYAGLWLFTTNYSFYPGSSVRKQDPMGSFQTHLSYNLKPRLWAAFDATFYTGGNTSVDGVELNDRQSNSRIGATVVFPVGKRHSVKIAGSRGVLVRYGANFTSLSVSWQSIYTGRQEKPEK